MLGYVTLGTNNLDRAREFYDALLAELGASRLAFLLDRLQYYGTSLDASMLCICRPANGEPHSPGNGQTVALPCGSREKVDQLYKKALELGGTDDGAPGERIPGLFYGAYIRDLDGNKLCFMHLTPG